MNKLAEICVKRPVFAAVVVLALVVVGLFSYRRLGVDRFPNIDFPFVSITTRLVGAAPEEIETEVTEKIEEAVNTISGIDELRSVSSEGVSQVIVAFILEKDVDVAAQEVRDKVNSGAAAAAEDHPAAHRGEIRSRLLADPDAGRLLEPKRRQKNVKLTLSPDARNQLIGAVRLMSATDPIWRVRRDDDEMAEVADEIEEASAIMWDAAGRVAGTPLHVDVILSGLLYDEAHVAIIPTWLLKGRGRRYERVAKRTPYIFEVYNPAQCYARYDKFGMCEHLRYISITADRVLADYGELAEGAVSDKQGRDILYLNEYWNDTMHAVWVDGSDKPIILDEHGLDFIPIVSTLVYGSSGLFQDNSYDVENHVNQPFLYTLRQSGLWNRQNLALTVAYTQLFSIGSNPMFVYRRNSPDKELAIDWSRPGGVVNIDQSEEFGPLLRNIIEPSMAQMMQLADEKITESTIYKQALGQSMSSGTPYSTVALTEPGGALAPGATAEAIELVIG